MTETVTSKTRILFVDDEPLVLQGLQRMLRPMRAEWEMAFVDSGPAALQAMAAEPFHVVVSDMRMPGMNGAQLLSEVKDLYPKTVRLVLSGHADKQLIMRCVGTAHQFLAKPCEPDALRTAISRASAFGNSMKSETIKKLIAQMDCLPSMPNLFSDIVSQLNREDASVEDIGGIIVKDIAMTAKLLKLVNSAFFGLRRQISDPTDAVNYLGFDTIKSLVLAVNAFATFEGQKTGPIALDSLWMHSLEVAQRAKLIAQAEDCTKAQIDESFIAGMLHDLGKLALAANLPEEYKRAFTLAETEQIPLHAAEDSVFGANHADIGGCLLSLWALPSAVVHAITFHHDLDTAALTSFGPLIAVHAADAIGHAIGEQSATIPKLNHRALESLQLTPRIAEWRKLAL